MNTEIIERNRPFMRAVVALVVLAALFLFVKTITEIKQYGLLGTGTIAQNTITVSGTGEASVVPDIATVNFSVIEEGATVKAAQDKATTRTNAAIKFLKDSGIAEKDIQTSNYNIYPRYDYSKQICTVQSCPPSQGKLVGYDVNQSITIKIRAIDKSGEILSGIGSLGVQNVSGISFSVDDEDKTMREARQEAIADAKEKANALAKDLGVKVVRIVAFEEGGSYPPIYYKNQAYDTATEGRGAAPSISPQIPVGENTVVSNVTITYEIR